MTKLRGIKGFIRDMNGSKEFVTQLKREDLALFPYQPDHILNRAADILAGG